MPEKSPTAEEHIAYFLTLFDARFMLVNRLNHYGIKLNEWHAYQLNKKRSYIISYDKTKDELKLKFSYSGGAYSEGEAASTYGHDWKVVLTQNNLKFKYSKCTWNVGDKNERVERQELAITKNAKGEFEIEGGYDESGTSYFHSLLESSKDTLHYSHRAITYCVQRFEAGKKSVTEYRNAHFKPAPVVEASCETVDEENLGLELNS